MTTTTTTGAGTMKLTANQLNALKTITRTASDGVGRTTDIRAAKGLEAKGLISILDEVEGYVSDHCGIAGNRTGTKAARCFIVE